LKKDKTLASAIFDSKLIDTGYEWTEKERFEVWTKIYGFDDKRIEASRLVAFLIPNLLGGDCTSECKMRSRKLAEKMIHFEDLLYTTRGGIAKKFYRDHLNHMLRVTLLSRAIARKIACFNFNDEDVRMLTLAALIHDVAYPLAEAFNMIADVTAAMEECYSSLKFPKGEPMFNVKNLLELFDNLGISSSNISATELGESLQSFNHGLVGALEFLSYVKDQRKYAPVVEAIAFHDTDFPHEVKFQEKKILAVLILSDEMQDWGRPMYFEQEPVIAEIKNFVINENTVQGCFDLSEGHMISPLRQVHGKLRNLSRIVTDRADFKFQLSFLLPTYASFDFSKFEKLLQSVYDIHPNMMELPAGISEELFLEDYYGARLTKEERCEITDTLSQKKLVSSSPFNTAVLYIDEARREVLQLPKSLGRLKEMIINNRSGSFSLELKGEDGIQDGYLYAQNESLGLVVCKKIVGEILVFHSILADLRKLTLAPVSFYLTSTDMKNILDKEKIPFENEVIDKIAGIHKCLQNSGLFSFSESKKNSKELRAR